MKIERISDNQIRCTLNKEENEMVLQWALERKLC